MRRKNLEAFIVGIWVAAAIGSVLVFSIDISTMHSPEVIHPNPFTTASSLLYSLPVAAGFVIFITLVTRYSTS